MTLLAAATYNVSSRLVLDCGGYFAVYGDLPRFTFAAGVTYSVADLYHPHGTRPPNTSVIFKLPPSPAPPAHLKNCKVRCQARWEDQ